MRPLPEGSHTAAHKGKQGVLLCRGARQYSKPEESDVHLRLLSRAKAGTHLGSLRKIAHSGSQGETGVLWMEALSLPSDRFARSGNPAWPEGRTAYFAALGSWPGGAPKERREPSGQRCAYARRCPEASRPRWAARLFYFCLNCGLYALRSGPFRVCETRGGITTLGVLCVLLKRWTVACQNGSFAAF